MTAFRLLSVGCSDAAIETWLAGELGSDVALHVDGVDLDAGALRRARDRMTTAGVPGVFKQGTPEDLPGLFPPASFDGVSSMEVIEHVPDVDAYLTALEAMVKPGGRIYLSSPDGAFGNGSNPHHLRALRALDLAEILRRRGELADMVVGSDGVAVAAYIPKPRRDDVAIFLGPCWAPWSPFDIGTKGLGGSETAAVRLAEALSDLGFVVTVYADTEDMCVRQVVYRHHSVFDPLETRGALICSRIPEVGDRPIAAATRMLWVHDESFGDRLTPARAEMFDYILCLSRWHEAHLAGLYPFAKDKLIRTRNGIALELFR